MPDQPERPQDAPSKDLAGARDDMRVLTEQSLLPEHLRDDAPFCACSTCLRRSWSDLAGAPCAMPQPDGSTCPGTFCDASAADPAQSRPAAPEEPEPVEVFASVRDFAVAAARSVAMLEPTLIQQAIDEADRALTLGPILDPSLWQRGQAELEQQTRLLRALLHFRLRLEEFRPGASA